MKAEKVRLEWNDFLSNDFFKSLDLSPHTGKEPPQPHKISTDSRAIEKDDWYIPLVGDTFDGHNYIKQALEKGATGFFYNSSFHKEWSDHPDGIEVSDTLKALGNVAKIYRLKHPSIKVIAITGSSGKTTVKDMLAHLLARKFNCTFSEKSFNNEIGVPKTIFKLDKSSEVLLLEMGARQIGDLDYLTDIAIPNIACCLNVGAAHSGVFGGYANTLKAKSEIYNHLHDEGIAIVNADQTDIMDLIEPKGLTKISTFGANNEASIRVLSESYDTEKGLSQIRIGSELDSAPIDITIPYMHSKLGINIAAVVCIAKAAGVETELIQSTMGDYRPSSGRFLRLQTSNYTLFDDCYNANPDSVRAALESFKMVTQKDDFRVIILGDMLELGDESQSSHLQIGADVVNLISPNLLVGIGHESRYILEGAKQKGLDERRTRYFKNIDEFIASQPHFPKNSFILMKASNSMKFDKGIAYFMES